MDKQTKVPTTGRLRWMDEAVVAALCIAEAALVWMIFDAIFAIPSDSPGAVPMWVAVSLIYGAALAPRLLEEFNIWNSWYEVILTCCVVLSTLASIKVICFLDYGWTESDWIREGLNGLIIRPSADRLPVWGVLGLLAYAWWRGRTRADPSTDAAFQMFKAGIMFAFVGAVLMTAIDHEPSTHRSAGPILIFFTSAIAAIGVARLANAERQTSSQTLARRISVAIAPAGLAAVIAVFIAGVFTQDTIDTVLWALGPLLWALSILFSIAVLIAALIAMIILSPLFWLVDGRQFNFKPIRIDTTVPISNPTLENTTARANEVPDAIRYIIAAGLLLLLFSGVTRFVLRRRTNRKREVDGEERKTVKPVFDVRGLVSALLRAVGFGKHAAIEDPLAGLRGDPQWAATIAIRERYAEYLVWSQAVGIPRDKNVTPDEHAAHLSKQMKGPGARGDVAELTAIYSRARYRATPAERHEADSANNAWRRLVRSAKSGT